MTGSERRVVVNALISYSKRYKHAVRAFVSLMQLLLSSLAEIIQQTSPCPEIVHPTAPRHLAA